MAFHLVSRRPFCSKRCPFGLKNSPSTFRRMINTLLAGLKGMNLQVFIDDICIATKTWEKHLSMLKATLELVIKANLKITPANCVCGANKDRLLGHEISEAGKFEHLYWNCAHASSHMQLCDESIPGFSCISGRMNTFDLSHTSCSGSRNRL